MGDPFSSRESSTPALTQWLSVPSGASVFPTSARFVLKHRDAETQRVERQSEDCFVKMVGSYLADPLTREESDGISPGIVA